VVFGAMAGGVSNVKDLNACWFDTNEQQLAA